MNDDDETDADAPAGWLGRVGEIGTGLVGGIRELITGEGEETLIGRWAPVFRAGRDVVSSFAELGWYLARGALTEDEAPSEELVGELAERTDELIASFPNIATLYEDVDAFDRRLRDGLDKSGSDATLFAYLEWLRGFVDAVIEKAVETALGEDEGKLSPERTAAFLDRIDELIGVVLERWVFPSVIDPGPRRPDDS